MTKIVQHKNFKKNKKPNKKFDLILIERNKAKSKCYIFMEKIYTNNLISHM